MKMRLIDADLLISNLRQKQESVFSESVGYGIHLAIKEVDKMKPVPSGPGTTELLAQTYIQAFNMGYQSAVNTTENGKD